jgi:hypothetical protein
VPTLNIKNQRVYELAKTLSERTGRSMASVIEGALEAQLSAMNRDGDIQRARKMAELDEIVARTSPVLRQLAADPFADLYDEATGLPR